MNRRQRKKLKFLKGAKLTDVQRWNLHHTFAAYIANGLRQFLAHDISGTPLDPPNQKKSPNMTAMSEEKWRGILKEMLWAFEQVENEYPASPLSKWNSEQLAELYKRGIMPFEFIEKDANGLVRVKDNKPEVPDEIWVAEDEYNVRIQHGVNLFAEYFFNLWD